MKSGAIERVALGMRSHSGWAAVSVVAQIGGEPVVVQRLRIVTADAAIAGSAQPYHAAEPLDFAAADALIRSGRESSIRMATAALQPLIEQFHVVACGVLDGSGRPLPDLAGILRSHAMIHTAEGEFFRDVLVRASEACSLRAMRVKEREVWERAALATGLGRAELERLLVESGRKLGPPWRQDEKLASLAGLVALS